MRVPSSGNSAPIPTAQVGGVRYNQNNRATREQGLSSSAPFQRRSLIADLAPGASQILGALDRMNAQNDDADVSDAMAQLVEQEQDFLYNGENSIYSRRGKNALTAVDDTKNWYEQTTNTIAGSLTSPRAQDKFRQQAQRQRLNTQGSVAKYQLGERSKWLVDSQKAFIESMSEKALNNYENTDAFNNTVNDIVREGYDLATNRLGMSDVEATQLTRNTISALQFQRAGRLLENGKPGQAFQILRDGDLQPQHAQQLSKAIVTTDKAYQKQLMDADAAGYVHLNQQEAYEIDALSAGFESGTAGDVAIGYDRTGGTSYGAYQISSQTMPEFISWLQKNGDERYKEVAEALEQSGPANTGNKSGEMPNTWVSLVAQGKLDREMQYQFIRDTHYEPALAMLPDSTQLVFKNDKVLQRALFSTSVQHGSKQAAEIVGRAYELSGGNVDDFINNLQKIRGEKFPSQSIEVQKAVQVRLEQERQQLIGMARARGAQEQGNIDLTSLQPTQNPDGTFSTINTTTYHDEVSGLEVVIPTTNADGLVMTEQEAIQVYLDTGQHLGKFNNIDNADSFRQRLADLQSWRLNEEFTFREPNNADGTPGSPNRISDLYNDSDRLELNQYHQSALRRQHEQNISERVNFAMQDLSNELKDIPFDEWDETFYQYLDTLPVEERRAMENAWSEQKGYMKRRQDGFDGSIGAEFIRVRLQEQQGSAQMRSAAHENYEYFRNQGMSQEGFENMITAIENLHNETPANIAATERIRTNIANGAYTNEDQIRAAAYGAGLSYKQLEENLIPFYQGASQDGLVFRNFNTFNQQLQYYVPDAKKRQKVIDSGAYNAFAALLPKDRAATDADISKAWSIMMRDGRIGGGVLWDSSANFLEAYSGGYDARWFPNLQGEERELAQKMFYEQYGRIGSNEEIAYLYKNQILGVPGSRGSITAIREIQNPQTNTQMIRNAVGRRLNEPRN